MGKSTNGPDLTDCEAMMRAIGAVHSGHVELVLKPAGRGLASGVSVLLRMTLDVLPGSSLPSEIVVENEWPCAVCGSFWGHVFNGLYALDFEIGQTYEQSSLWKE